MIAEIGNIALLLALVLALVLGTLPIIGAMRGNASWIALAKPLAIGQSMFVITAFALLAAAFIGNDFSVRFVAFNSNSALPLIYRIAAVWGGHEGSLLLWATILAGWTIAVAQFSRHLPEDMRARVLGVMGLISVGFLSFMLFTSNPFDRLMPPAMDGRDLNPQLQDPGMVFHPPVLYMGYVGFSVAFAFAISALLSGRLDATWARWSRPWTTVAWIFLTIGIAAGSGWAYYVLGWGGWWFWDSVENASFMPWLIGTALMHSLVVTEKRGSFKTWTVLLAILAFALSLLGTFLVRSGVLTSVHAFATDPRRGIFILGFIGVVCGASLGLFVWRAPKVGLGGRFESFSRETFLLANNVLLAVAAGVVFLGTLYPLFLDALGMGKISVGPPYFEAVFVPVIAPTLLLMGAAPLLRWKRENAVGILRRLLVPAVVSLVAASALPIWLGRWSFGIGLGLFIAAWILAMTVEDLRGRVAAMAGRGGVASRLATLSRSYYAMVIAHLGIAVFVVGVTLVKGYETEQDVRMAVGDTVTVKDYVFTFKGVTPTPGPNYMAAAGLMEVTQNGELVATLHPEKRVYTASRMPVTEAAIDVGLLRDLYVSLGESLGSGAWIVRVYHKPFIDWIWGGCVLMALGGLLAVTDRRYRLERGRVALKTHGAEVQEGIPAPAVAVEAQG
jgi:cytochrome c-type biogenesis protein CcmF